MKTAEEFWAQIDKKEGDNACWLWKAGVDGNGYGCLSWNGTKTYAHRVAYALTNNIKLDDLPTRAKIRRSCEELLCVRHIGLKESRDGETVKAESRKNRSTKPVKRSRSPVPLLVVDHENRLRALIVELTSEADKVDKDRKRAFILCAEARAAMDDVLLKLTSIKDASDRMAEQLLPIYRNPDFVRIAEEGKMLMEEGEDK